MASLLCPLCRGFIPGCPLCADPTTNGFTAKMRAAREAKRKAAPAEPKPEPTPDPNPEPPKEP